ncbi:MAG: SIR2 family protein [Sedimentisphaerales bacterium]|nr:SIR2 family protein [Sedimentisphaerales bacterium]
MDLDWNTGSMPFLKKQLVTGNVVLFLGAGFSSNSKNIKNVTPPLGSELAKLLIEECGYSHQNEILPTAYEGAQKILGSQKLNSLLEEQYNIKEFEEWYHILKLVTWYKIYTTNIDNLLQNIYSHNNMQALKTIVCPEEIEERIQHFNPLQCVHLHGHVDHLSKGLTFTLPDFAQQTVKPNPWYQQLIDDLYRTTFLFVGTNIEEPQFQHYLNLREAKFSTSREYRPKSFIVNINISPIRERTFANRNIESIKCTASDFFQSLKKNINTSELALDAVRTKVFPYITFSPTKSESYKLLLRYYDHIRPNNLPLSPMVKGESFFLGAEPTWVDIANERDAARKIDEELVEKLYNKTDVSFRCYILHGPAGSGKSTTLMRVAYTIATNGEIVYYAKGTERIDLSPIFELCKHHPNKRLFLFIDNFRRQLGPINDAKDDFRKTKNLTIILCERTNTYYSRSYTVADLNPDENRMPDLCKDDVEKIIKKLEKHHFLGALRQKNHTEQVSAFMNRASKQLLVAMKEATSGKGFGLILQSEFSDLPEKAQLIYLICCIAVDKGAPGVYRRHLLACIDEGDFKKTQLIKEILRGIIVPANEDASLVKPRHRLIAHWISSEIANIEIKYAAITKYLLQISSDIIPNEIRRRSPTYLAYRGMINSESLWEELEQNEDMIFALYEHLQPHYSGDSLFWLHYGMVYIKAGYLDTAENYLNQSLALNPTGYHTWHQMGMLYLKQAIKSRNPGAMKKKADEGIKLLIEQIKNRGDSDSYPYTAYLGHVSRWYTRAGKSLISSEEWEELRQISSEALRKYPRDEYVIDADKKVNKRYLSRAIKQI